MIRNQLNAFCIVLEDWHVFAIRLQNNMNFMAERRCVERVTRGPPCTRCPFHVLHPIIRQSITITVTNTGFVPQTII